MQLKIIDHSWKIALLAFFVIISVSLGMLMLLNLSVVNTIYQPILQYMSLFTVLWQEDPMGSLQFISSKSIFSFAHNDPRSGLDLWTFEIDSITLIAYAICSLFFAKIAFRYLQKSQPEASQSSLLTARKNLKLALFGGLVMCFSFTYMTAIEHCAGPTWVGFVILYGLGFEGFQLSPIYQWAGGVIGITCMGIALFNRSPNNPNSILSTH